MYSRQLYILEMQYSGRRNAASWRMLLPMETLAVWWCLTRCTKKRLHLYCFRRFAGRGLAASCSLFTSKLCPTLLPKWCWNTFMQCFFVVASPHSISSVAIHNAYSSNVCARRSGPSAFSAARDICTASFPLVLSHAIPTIIMRAAWRNPWNECK